MDKRLEQILTNLKDAGCNDTDLDKAEKLYQTGDMSALILHFRKCRCALMDDLHESQRKVDRLDYLIRETSKVNA